jgi:hypothetical protein
MEAANTSDSRCAEQDQRITGVFEREHPRLRSFIRRPVPHRRDVEDILQEVFCELVNAYRLMKPRAFFALDARTGKQLWKTPKGGPYTTTPVIKGEHLWICSDRGVLACHRLSTGELVYQERLGAGTFSSSPVIAGDRIYIGSEDGEMFVASASPNFKLFATNSFSEGIFATPAVSGGGCWCGLRPHSMQSVLGRVDTARSHR